MESERRLITIAEASDILRVSRFFLYAAKSTHREPFNQIFVSVGKCVRVDLQELNALIDRLKVAQQKGA